MLRTTVRGAVLLAFALAAGFQLYAAGTQATGAAATGELPLIDVTVSMPDVNFAQPDDAIAMDRVKQYLENRFNMNLTYHSYLGYANEYQEEITRLMAAGSAPDLLNAGVGRFTPEPTWREWVEDELIVDLGEHVFGDPERYPALKLAFDHPVFKYLNVIYTGDPEKYVAWYSPSFRKRVFGGITFNGYLLDEMGLGVPQTYDEFVAAMRRAKQQFDIPGFGWVSYNATRWNYVDLQFFNPFGLYIEDLRQDANGNWYDAAIDPRNRDRWRELQGFAREGLLDPKWIENGYDVVSVDFVADKILSIEYGAPNPGQYAFMFREHFKKTHPDATPSEHFPMAPPLKGADGQIAPFYEIPFSNGNQWIVPFTTEHPDRVLDLMNFLASDEWQIMFNWGVKGIHYTKDDFSDYSDAEFLKDTLIWHPGNTTRSQYAWFRWFNHGGQAMAPFQEYGDWLEGLKQARTDLLPYQLRQATTAEYQYGIEVQNQHLQERRAERPLFWSFMSWTAEEEQIRTRLDDIRDKWFTWFLTGQENLDQGWDDFVREYKAAGADQIVAAFAAKYREAETLFNQYVNS